jgi:carboxynorspermidine decarboxylase
LLEHKALCSRFARRQGRLRGRAGKPPRSQRRSSALVPRNENTIMTDPYLARLRPERFPSPCFVTDMERIRANAAVLDMIQRRTGAKILLALKAFAQWSVFGALSRAQGGPLYGCCVSSPDEARLARELFGGEVHAFAAGYSDDDCRRLLELADHVSFNSFGQWRRFRPLIRAWNERTGGAIRCGIRINPEHSEGAPAVYNPCSPGSRLGVRQAQFEPEELEGISGLHFHTLCQQGADALDRTLDAVEASFGPHLRRMEWLNMGGGHHITRPDYDLDRLCRRIEAVRDRYGLQVYLEPGEAVALNAGVLVAAVLDVIEADIPIAILDTSAVCHMPDVLEMPYRPEVIGAGRPGELPWTCRLGGKSCLAGDVIGEYAFAGPLAVGDRLVFADMAIYTMVKTTTFNGLRLPSIAVWDSRTDTVESIRHFGYEDFSSRLS